MNSKVPKWLFLVPVIYLGIIGLFISLHLSDGERVFSQGVGPLHVEAHSSGGVNSRYESIKVSFFGFILDFPEGIPVVGAGGSSRVIPVVSVEVLDSSIRLHGENGAALAFSLGFSPAAGVFQAPDAYAAEERTGEEGTTGVRIEWNPPERERMAAAQLSLLSSYQTRRIEAGIPLFSMAGESVSYLCTTGGSTELDAEGVLNIRLAGDTQEEQESGCIIAPYGGDEPLRYWFFGGSEAKDTAVYNELYEQWRENSFVGWESRYNPGESSWRKGGSGMSSFESIITAYAAESMRRNSTTGIANFSESMDAYGGRHAFFSSPYLGNIVSTDEEHATIEETRAGDIRGYVDNDSPELFAEEENLIRFFIWYGDEALTAEFDEYAAALEISSFEDPEALVYFFSTAMEAAQMYPERFPGLAGRIDDLYTALLGRIVRVGNTPLLPTGEKEIDSKLTLILAHALMEYGELVENTLAADLGATMGVYVVQETEGDGFLPSLFDIEGGEAVPGRADLAPENVYPLLTSNRFYPRLVSLSEELGSDVRLWTSSQAVGATINGNRISITLNFAVGETQYVAVRGIPPFSQFNLYGMRWGSDRRFQTYGVGGWYYDRDRRTLYVKIRHQNQIERLVMEGAGS